MIPNLNAGEIVLLALLGLFIFGPERLPRLISDAAAMLRSLRDTAREATAELRSELGEDIDLGLPMDDLNELRSLNPRAFARSLLEDSPPAAPATAAPAAPDAPGPGESPAGVAGTPGAPAPGLPRPAGGTGSAVSGDGSRRGPARFDPDAT